VEAAIDSGKGSTQMAEGKKSTGRFWQVFWLSFLVISLWYAGYSFWAPSNQIAWTKDLSAAQIKAAELDKPMVLFFTGKWCSPCRVMKREVWADEEVMDVVNKGFLPVLLDVDDPDVAPVLSQFGIQGTPWTMVMEASGVVKEARFGAIGKADFLKMLGS
jgi:thioredoxin 1